MMSRNSSVAVLADCTDLDNNPVTLMGLNGSSPMVSIENETILSDDTGISPNRVIGSVSFKERLQSTDLASLFPRGNLNIKIKKKRRSNESSPSTLQSPENISYSKSNINATEPDENVSASFEERSEERWKKKDESTKPFNKHMYLKKKSVNISIDLNSVSDPIAEKGIEENATESYDSVSKELIIQNHNDIINDCCETASLKEYSENKKMEKKEQTTEPINEHLHLNKKSVNISVDSNSLSDPITEKILEGNSIENVSKESVVVQNSNSSVESKVEISNSSEIKNGTITDEEKIESSTKNNNVSNNQISNCLKSINTCPLEQDCSVGNSRTTKKVKSVSSSNNIDEGSEESHPILPEINSVSKQFSIVTPARNLRDRSINNKSLNVSKRSRSDNKDHAYNLGNSAKKNKSSVEGNEDFTENISIISNTKPLTPSRFKYHSTPISRGLSKKKRSKAKDNSNSKIEDENIQQDDKMIQVSKSIFGSSTEVTNATVSKKKLIQFSNYSSPNSDESENRTKRKSEIKNLDVLESIGESRSYHSNLVSTLEDNSSHYGARKSVKRVAFKSISSNENSSGYQNSSNNFASRNRKSVGFRNAISLIEDTMGENSEGDMRDAINSESRIGDATPGTINDSKSGMDKSDVSNNCIAEVPEIILTENEMEHNEMSKECSLLNKLFEMAEKKKSGRNVATRQTKLSKCRRKLRSRATPDSIRRDKWVSPNLIKFLNKKLMTDALDHIVNTERVVSTLCSAVSAVRNLKDVNDIDFALLPLKNILLKFRVCCNMVEYCTFISRFTPFQFQRKAVPLEGYFGSYKRGIKRKLTDPILTETEKMNVFS